MDDKNKPWREILCPASALSVMGCSQINTSDNRLTWKGAKAVAEKMIGLPLRSLGLKIHCSVRQETMNLRENKGQFGHSDLGQSRDLEHLESRELKLHKNT